MINLHFKETDNIGDRMCAPGLYYPDIEVLDINNHLHTKFNDLVIYGGGAIAGPAIRHARLQESPTVFWGGGSTRRFKEDHPVPDYSAFDLYGTRDIGQGHHVPCVSCKHPVFDQNFCLQHEVVFYGHRAVKPLLEQSKNYPYLDNEHDSFEEVISFLASGSRVVTSSYHGAYWAMLLNRPVIIHGFGSKFNYLPKSSPNLLHQCRSKNDAFYNKVLNLRDSL